MFVVEKNGVLYLANFVSLFVATRTGYLCAVKFDFWRADKGLYFSTTGLGFVLLVPISLWLANFYAGEASAVPLCEVPLGVWLGYGLCRALACRVGLFRLDSEVRIYAASTTEAALVRLDLFVYYLGLGMLLLAVRQSATYGALRLVFVPLELFVMVLYVGILLLRAPADFGPLNARLAQRGAEDEGRAERR